MMSLSSRSVTGALPCGQTTRAFFQSSSVHASRRAQSVRSFIVASCLRETRVIRSSVIPSRPSGADNAAALVAPRVRYLYYEVTELSYSSIPLLAVIATPVLGCGKPAVEDLDRCDNVDAMLLDIGLALRLVPFAVHCVGSNRCTYAGGDIPDA